MAYDVVVNGVTLVGKKLKAWHQNRATMNAARMEMLLKGRRAPGGHAPYWGTGHESVAAAMPESMAKEHMEWMNQNGVVGTHLERSADGACVMPVSTSPGAKREYLAKRGLIDVSGCNVNVDTAKQPKRETKEEMRRRIEKQVRARPEIVEELKCRFGTK